jgi:uncharacterized membrane protein YfcA
LDALEIALLLAGGLVAGVINTLAGGGSLLTVPLLVLLGLPGSVANGTNRVGILVQNLIAVWRFRSEGISELSRALPVLVPVLLGSVIGATAIAQLTDDAFERAFGVVMVLLLVPTLRRPARGRDHPAAVPPWPSALRFAVFFLVGLYGGAFQAGVGIALLFALSHSGLDLVRANAVKVVVIAALTAVAIPVFIAEGQVTQIPALTLAVGFAAGGALGVRLAVAGGEKLIRPVLVVAVVALAGRMLGLY